MEDPLPQWSHPPQPPPATSRASGPSPSLGGDHARKDSHRGQAPAGRDRRVQAPDLRTARGGRWRRRGRPHAAVRRGCASPAAGPGPSGRRRPRSVAAPPLQERAASAAVLPRTSTPASHAKQGWRLPEGRRSGRLGRRMVRRPAVTVVPATPGAHLHATSTPAHRAGSGVGRIHRCPPGGQGRRSGRERSGAAQVRPRPTRVTSSVSGGSRAASTSSSSASGSPPAATVAHSASSRSGSGTSRRSTSPSL